MAFTIRAILLAGSSRQSFKSLYPAVPCIDISPGMQLVPLTKEVLATMGDESLVLSIGDEGEFDGFTERIVHTLERVSMAGRAAFVGAEYFGGVGTQWASVYENGLLLVAPESGHGAVNHALKVLGVIAQDTDEFDAVGLGRFRCTEDWLKKER